MIQVLADRKETRSENAVRVADISWRERLLVSGLALIIRVPGIWLIRNAHEDAYSYVEAIGQMSAKLLTGSFAFSDLFGFWLPLYPFLGAVLTSLTGLAPMFAGKTISALSGAGTALLIFDLAFRLTHRRQLAWIAFAVCLLEPGFAFVSGLSMTEAGHVFLVLAVVTNVIAGRWHFAAVCGAVAGLVRIESWLFLALLPALQYVRERRISPATVAILLFAPLSWLAISFAAKGDTLAYFAERQKYIRAYLEFEPARRGFARAPKDFLLLLLGAHPVVFFLATAASASALSGFWRQLKHPREDAFPPFVLATTFLAMLGFLVLAYVTRSQPVIWDRYGIVLFVLGLPMAIIQLRRIGQACRSQPVWPGLITTLVVLLSVAHLIGRTGELIVAFRDDVGHERIADTIRALAIAEGWDSAPVAEEGFPLHCFCDDPAVRVLSGIAVTRFLRTPGHEEVTSLPDLLRQHRIRYVVSTAIENSLPIKLSHLSREGPVPVPFKLLRVERSPYSYGPDIWLYEDLEVAALRDKSQESF